MKQSTFYIACAASTMLLLTTSCAPKKKKDPLEQLQEETIAAQVQMQKDVDRTIAGNAKQIEQFHKDAKKQYALNEANTSVSIKDNGCKYAVKVKDLDKDHANISYDGAMLSIVGRTKSDNPYSYSLSVPENCKGEPEVNYGKDLIDIAFKQ